MQRMLVLFEAAHQEQRALIGLGDYPVIDEAALLQSRLHSLLVRKHLENTVRERETAHGVLRSCFGLINHSRV